MEDNLGIPLINIHKITKRFGENTAVDNLSLEVFPGEIYGLVGPDGAGKTTTLRMICGALRAYYPSPESNISVMGIDVNKDPDGARNFIGYLPQRFALYEELTVMENLRFFAEIHSIPTEEWKPRTVELLEFVDLSEFSNTKAGNLSGGMKQKLGLAVSLIHDPEVFLLDEPTTGVDPVTRQDFWQLIIKMISKPSGNLNSRAALVTTPYMDEAERCSRIGLMSGGKLIVEGTPDSLRNQFSKGLIELVGEPTRLLRQMVLLLPQVEDAVVFGDRLHIVVPPGAEHEVIQHILHEIPQEMVKIFHARPSKPRLEDVYLEYSRSQDVQ